MLKNYFYQSEILIQTDWVSQYDQSLALLQKKKNQLFAGFLNHGLKKYYNLIKEFDPKW